MNLGENLKRIRNSQGITQKKLADMLGISVISIQNYENNRREPRLKDLKRIAKVLNTTVSNIVSEEEI